jgi:hypothetical protein
MHQSLNSRLRSGQPWHVGRCWRSHLLERSDFPSHHKIRSRQRVKRVATRTASATTDRRRRHHLLRCTRPLSGPDPPPHNVRDCYPRVRTLRLRQWARKTNLRGSGIPPSAPHCCPISGLIMADSSVDPSATTGEIHTQADEGRQAF